MYQFALFPVSASSAASPGALANMGAAQASSQGAQQGESGFSGILSSLQSLADEAGIDKTDPQEWQTLLEQHPDQLAFLESLGYPSMNTQQNGQSFTPLNLSTGQNLPSDNLSEEIIDALSENLAMFEQGVFPGQGGMNGSFGGAQTTDPSLSIQSGESGAWLLSGQAVEEGGAQREGHVLAETFWQGLGFNGKATAPGAAEASTAASRSSADSDVKGVQTAWQFDASQNPSGMAVDQTANSGQGGTETIAGASAAFNPLASDRVGGEANRQPGALRNPGTRPGADLSDKSGATSGLQPAGAPVSDETSFNLAMTRGAGHHRSSNESDLQFRAHIDALSSGEDGADLPDELLQSRQNEAASSSRLADLQSKIPGAGLRQYATGVGVPVGDPEWANQMGQKIVWMTGRNIQSAEIQLNPRELGPVEVKIHVQNDQANITINAQNANVREMLEQNVHRLRDMMGANGVELGDVDVGGGQPDQSFADTFQQSRDGGGTSSRGNGGAAQSADGSDETIVSDTSAVGLVDYYA